MAFNLRLGASPTAKSAHEESEELAGGDISLVLQMPDGRVLEEVVRTQQFKVGVNVEWVAHIVAQKMELELERVVRCSQELRHEGVKLLGPMALCDYPQLSNRSVITVSLIA